MILGVSGICGFSTHALSLLCSRGFVTGLYHGTDKKAWWLLIGCLFRAAWSCVADSQGPPIFEVGMRSTGPRQARGLAFFVCSSLASFSFLRPIGFVFPFPSRKALQQSRPPLRLSMPPVSWARFLCVLVVLVLVPVPVVVPVVVPVPVPVVVIAAAVVGSLLSSRAAACRCSTKEMLLACTYACATSKAPTSHQVMVVLGELVSPMNPWYCSPWLQRSPQQRPKPTVGHKKR